ncbi:HlyD family efflux transporter periplasmic adaptor subunit [Amycolatopsis cynarae]|uniref:HlyD family efflux transporter periplasmic adaptor subunit n=1 Tax=Amycolatopsis cynarae TaxID=2995223 RepID=A0ABY7B2B3_9PSEU|nr:biotin/lipoyl-binding protein [Amycolatopsis sp. HUAS 11-8]WAL65026.1 HlyD family efflux transporter periplasmic adaptor subunit [Amycolatopsis sp. HUAS 11-8]
MAERVRRVLTVTGVVVVVAGIAVVWATSASSAPGYRTATAGPASVTATLDTTGTIQAVDQATVSFPVSGQVASVGVTAGQQVTTGQTLARLDTTALSSQLASAQSTLATAQARLAADQSGQGTAAGTGRVTPALYRTAGTSGSGGSGDLKAAQDAVIEAQQQVDKDLAAVSAALTAQQKACQPVVNPDPKQPPSQDTVDSCTAAIQQTQDAQQATSTDEQKLADAENALSAMLAKAASTPQSTSPGTQAAPSQTPKSGTGSRSSTGSSAQGSSPGSSPGTKTSTPASAQQLAADQAAIDAANAQVAVAQQNLAAATMVSPIDGTIGQVGLTAGQASSGGRIVVLGHGAVQVSTAVSDSQAGQVKPGQRVLVTPDGSGTPITGSVTAIGLLASTTSSGSPSYPVTISLPPGTELHQGATAAVSIVTGSAEAAVTVPTSAVRLLGNSAGVTVLSGQQTEVRRVTVGVVGPAVTEIKTGLNAGEQVVLADLSQPLPTANTNTRGLVGGGARPGGQGGNPGGGPPAGAAGGR